MTIISEGDYSANEKDLYGQDIDRTLKQMAVEVEKLERLSHSDPNVKKFMSLGHCISMMDRLAQLRGYVIRQTEQDNPLEV